MSLLWSILGQAMGHAHRDAVIDDQRHYSYGKLAGGAMFMAEAIDAATSNPHVGILLPTGGAFPMALLGTWLAGRVAVPLNYLLKGEEIRYVIGNSGIDTVLTAGAMLDYVKSACDGELPIPADVKLLKVEDLDYTGLPPLRWPPRPRAEDLAIILYTSGTSGKPKGVMLTHGNLESNVEGAIIHAGITSADTFLGVLPQFHSFGLTALTLIPLRLGCKVVYSARFVPKRIVELIRKHQPDIFMAIPSMYGALLSVKDAAPADFSSVRLAISGGEPLPDAVFEVFRDRLHVHLLEGFGLTETSPATHWSTPAHNRRHSVGRALPRVETRIIDEGNRILPPNQDGEIVLAGPNIMKGYYRLPDETRATFIDLNVPATNGSFERKRFFRTGDIGRIDDEGYLYITGRKKEMLIIGGENVFPREIEEVLNQHASINASAVIGKADGMRGEVPIAFVELREGQEFDEPGLRTWCRQHLAGYKVPREIRHIEKLPRNPTGKIMRRELRAQA